MFKLQAGCEWVWTLNPVCPHPCVRRLQAGDEWVGEFVVRFHNKCVEGVGEEKGRVCAGVGRRGGRDRQRGKRHGTKFEVPYAGKAMPSCRDRGSMCKGGTENTVAEATGRHGVREGCS